MNKHKVIYYAKLIIPLLSLLSIAVFLPTLLFKFQDLNLLKEASYSQRAGLDYAAINTEYEIDLYKRLSTFADKCKNGTSFYTISSDYEGEYNGTNFQETVLTVLYSAGYYVRTELFKGEEWEILQKEYYIIYDKEANESMFFCWFLHVRLDESTELKVLIDGKDETIYYMEIYDYYYSEAIDDIKRDQMLRSAEYLLYEMLTYYYQPDDILYSPNEREEIALWDADMKKKEEINNSQETFHAEENFFEILLYYDSNYLTFSNYYNEIYQGDFSGVFCFGILDIAELIPNISLVYYG
ncbi:hypothetical protein LJC58_06215 [Lachnospiraceae bacterium OttesenSCG-928-D06]|nr:hypothetical protein [Lachnospiraceae bacterium OttesenSCG-928-D06]